MADPDMRRSTATPSAIRGSISLHRRFVLGMGALAALLLAAMAWGGNVAL